MPFNGLASCRPSTRRQPQPRESPHEFQPPPPPQGFRTSGGLGLFTVTRVPLIREPIIASSSFAREQRTPLTIGRVSVFTISGITIPSATRLSPESVPGVTGRRHRNELSSRRRGRWPTWAATYHGHEHRRDQRELHALLLHHPALPESSLQQMHGAASRTGEPTVDRYNRRPTAMKRSRCAAITSIDGNDLQPSPSPGSPGTPDVPSPLPRPPARPVFRRGPSTSPSDPSFGSPSSPSPGSPILPSPGSPATAMTRSCRAQAASAKKPATPTASTTITTATAAARMIRPDMPHPPLPVRAPRQRRRRAWTTGRERRQSPRKRRSKPLVSRMFKWEEFELYQPPANASTKNLHPRNNAACARRSFAFINQDPLTSTSAPASRHARPVTSLIPPSTEINH